MDQGLDTRHRRSGSTGGVFSALFEIGFAFFKKRGCPLPHLIAGGPDTKERRFEEATIVQTHVQPRVHSLDAVADRERAVGHHCFENPPYRSFEF